MRFIKNAIVYWLELPDIEDFESEILINEFTEIEPFESRSIGFAPIAHTDELVSAFVDGYGFSIRIDEKVVPASAVKRETTRLAGEFEDMHGYKPGRRMMREFKEEATDTLVRKALTKTTTVNCYYDTYKNYLYVPVASKARADLVTSLLIKSVGSIKAQTIYVSSLRHGLTTRLKSWMDGDWEVFGDMEPAGEAWLRKDSERVTFNLSSLDDLDDGTNQALNQGFDVTALRLNRHGVSFRLTDEFHLRQIKLDEGESQVVNEGHEGMSEDEYWAHTAATEVFLLRGVMDALCEMFEYKPLTDESDNDEPGDDWLGDEDDPAAGL